ncbi:MAG: hypothetical protein KatS3mg044_0413 [Rhodothermaceae bacterium]|nr:MAG: hypothetical protein KatS3mg044_0413 [Rhodothermaceae bacterium]
MDAPEHVSPKARAWSEGMAISVMGLLLFECLSGLAIYLLPFSVSNQVMVLVHTGLGLVFMVPYAGYQWRHWTRYRRMPWNHVTITGYAALVATLVAVVTGLVLTAQALFGTRIGYGWDLAHLLSTFVVLASALPHVVVLLVRNYRARRLQALRPVAAAQWVYARRAVLLPSALTVLVVLAASPLRPPAVYRPLPDDYNLIYGADRPFAPSLARTATNRAIDPEALGGSASCGRAGCHKEIYDEWATSAHRYSALDPAFRAIQTIMGEQNGPESTRYCGGCHDPISLFSGTKNLYREELTNPTGLDEGISCVACHAIRETDVQGNANYVIDPPERYLFETSDYPVAQTLSDFLIRAYPGQHVASLQHKLFKSPEFCAACHKQFIDEEINNVGWVQLQNQFDNWRKSRWNHPGQPDRTIECRECHMPLNPSRDPAAGDDVDYNRTPDDGRHRSHRFLGANQFIPAHLKLPGAEEHVRLTEQWLRGEIEIPEIADKWKEGPAVPIEISAPPVVAPGDTVTVAVHLTNNKVGHDFPTGPLDIIQAWVELEVTDEAGRTLFATGRRDERHFIEPGTFMFKAEAVDQYGNLIDRHNLWEMVGVRFRRALFPGFSDQAVFRFACPADVSEPPAGDPPTDETFTFRAEGAAGDTLHVRARLLYRKIDQFLLNQLFGEESGITAPVTEMSSATFTLRLQSSS